MSNSRRHLTALLMGYYGAGNLGDEMMLFTIRNWLRCQDIEATVLTERPGRTTAESCITAVQNVPLLGEWAWFDSWFRGRALSVAQAIRKHDFFIAGGGDLIRDDRGWRPFLFVIEKLILAHWLGKPIFLVNVGIGRPTTAYGRILLRYVLRRAHRIIVRDERSQQVCNDLGAEAHATYAPDIVETLPRILGNRTKPHKMIASRKFILVSLRSHSNAFGQYDLTASRIQMLAEALERTAIGRGLEIVFLPFQKNECEDDNVIHHKIASAIRGAPTRVLEWMNDFPQIVDLFSGAEFVLAMRLHAAVLGVAVGRPVVVMPYDHKVWEFVRQRNVSSVLTERDLDDICSTKRALEQAVLGQTRPSALAQWDTLQLL